MKQTNTKQNNNDNLLINSTTKKNKNHYNYFCGYQDSVWKVLGKVNKNKHLTWFPINRVCVCAFGEYFIFSWQMRTNLVFLLSFIWWWCESVFLFCNKVFLILIFSPSIYTQKYSFEVYVVGKRKKFFFFFLGIFFTNSFGSLNIQMLLKLF